MRILGGTTYIFIVVREPIVRGIAMEMAIETAIEMTIVIKRKVLRKMIAMIETMSY